MKTIRLVMFGAFLLMTSGCGDSAATANKNLKAVDPNAPPPTAAGAGTGGGAAKAEVLK